MNELEQQANETGEGAAVDVPAGFTLPQDYDAITGVTGMNAEILNLIGQVTEQMTAEHAVQLEQVHTDNKATVEQLNATINDLTERYRTVDQSLAQALIKAEDNRRLYNEEVDARKEAESKRDNAALALDEAITERDKALSENKSLKSQIDELEGMVRTLKKSPAPSGGVQLVSTLKPETEEERKARLEKARLDTINKNLSEKFGIPPLKVPSLPTTKPEEQKDDAFQGNTGHDGYAESAGAVSEVVSGADGAGTAGEVAQATQPSLEERVAALEAWKAQVDAHLFAPMNVAI